MKMGREKDALSLDQILNTQGQAVFPFSLIARSFLDEFFFRLKEQ